MQTPCQMARSMPGESFLSQINWGSRPVLAGFLSSSRFQNRDFPGHLLGILQVFQDG